MNPVNVKWKREEDGLPIVNQYSYLGVEMSKYCSWDALLLGCFAVGMHTYIVKVI